MRLYDAFLGRSENGFQCPRRGDLRRVTARSWVWWWGGLPLPRNEAVTGQKPPHDIEADLQRARCLETHQRVSGTYALIAIIIMLVMATMVIVVVAIMPVTIIVAGRFSR